MCLIGNGSKLLKKIWRGEIEGHVVAGQELRGERIAIAEVRRKIGIGREERITIVEKDYGEVEKLFLINEDEEDEEDSKQLIHMCT